MANNLTLPGFEIEEEIDEFHEGVPSANKTYFDAADLIDGPTYQVNQENQTYIIHVVCDSWDVMRELIELFSGRKNLAKSARFSTLSAYGKHIKTKETLLEFWRKIFNA